MKRRILILGAGLMQRPAITFAKEMGIETVVADGDPQAVCAGLADRFENIDLKDKEGLEALGRALMNDGGLSAVMTAGTDFSASVAWVAEKLGLPGIPYETALDASDKERMRRRFKEAGVPSPEFIIVHSSDFSQNRVPQLPFSFPVVVKPVDNMGARGCRRVDSEEELRSALTDALSFSRSGRAIVEEYMEGPEFSVDAIVYQGEITICGLADRHIFFPPYFIEMGHTMPTSLPNDRAEWLLSVFKAGVKALGITNGAAKGDVKLTPRGPMIGEIAARLSGGYMSGWTYPYASGVEPTRAAISVALGEAPKNLEPTRNWTSAERAFISIPGQVSEIYGLDEARSIPGVRDIFPRITRGSPVKFPENNVTKCGNVISVLPDREAAIEAAERAARKVWIRLSAPNKETAAFLNLDRDRDRDRDLRDEERPFPPSAYMLPGPLQQKLLQIPDPENRYEKILSGALAVLPFHDFLDAPLTDYHGRSPKESLEVVRTITGLELPIVEKPSDNFAILGRRFWKAFVRGSYQGALYHIDELMFQAVERNR
jgi:biotin carboxylase